LTREDGGVPELPDIEVYVECLARRVTQTVLRRVAVRSPFVLRSVDPPLEELEGGRVTGVRRMGKRVVIELEGERFIVIHLMIAGRLHWHADAAPRHGKNTLAAWTFDSGALSVSEAGTQRRASIHFVRGPSQLAEHDPGGVEPLTCTAAEFIAAIRREPRTIKRALTDPSTISGIGNAYSDEILHRARMSPLARTRDLEDGALTNLFHATRDTLTEWIERLRAEAGDDWPRRVTAFRPEMAVHGRFGKPCPVCGSKVQRLVRAENEVNYCPTCQTGGKVLRDRSLSRLLRDDWPDRADDWA
jgi:formamidopyrimidine-DNA glycosylase